MIEPRQPASGVPGEPSAQMRRNRRIRQLRRVLLVLTVAAVAGVALLFVLRRPGRTPSSKSALTPAVPIEQSGDMVTIGEGFERTFSEGDRPLFTARGAKFGVDRHGQVFLEEVGFTIYREDGARYEVESGRARVRPEDRSARLTEGVKILGPDDVELTTPELIVASDAAILRGRGPVAFRIGDEYTGTADGLRAAVRARRFHLTGTVEMESTPAAPSRLSLDAQHLVLDRNRNLMETTDGAVLDRPGERVSAEAISLFFAEDRKTVRTVQARGNVIAQLPTDGNLEFLAAGDGEEPDGGVPGRMLMRTESLDLFLDADGKAPRNLEMIGGPDGRAVARSVGRPGEAAYRVLAPRMTTGFEEGKPRRIEAAGGVLLVVQDAAAEAPRAAAGSARPAAPMPARTAQGERAVATFDAAGALSRVELFDQVALADGTMKATAGRGVAAFDASSGGFSRVELFGDVVLDNGEMKATGARADFDVGKDSGKLTGTPAAAVSPRGRMEAPEISYTLADGLIRGSGGVRARLDQAADTALGGTPLARGDGPVWVEATEGFFRDQPRSFLFSGKVRAWRGDDRIVADRLEGHQEEDRLTATGSVRTLFTQDAGPGAAGGRATPIEVAAERMDYRRSERLLVYTGNVVAKQEGRTLQGEEMRIVLAAGGGGMERLTATGSVRLENEDRTLSGERAVYDPAARTIEVSAAAGGKVTMRSGDGNVIEGPRMLYDIDRDRVQILGRDGAKPAEPGAP